MVRVSNTAVHYFKMDIAKVAPSIDITRFVCPAAADHALFPTMVFIDYLTPRIYGWDSYLDDKPKLKVSFRGLTL